MRGIIATEILSAIEAFMLLALLACAIQFFSIDKTALIGLIGDMGSLIVDTILSLI